MSNIQHYKELLVNLDDHKIGFKELWALCVIAEAKGIFGDKEILKRIGGTKSAAKGNLDRLKQKGFIESVYNTKGDVRYILTDDSRQLFGLKNNLKWAKEDFQADRADKDNKIANEN